MLAFIFFIIPPPPTLPLPVRPYHPPYTKPPNIPGWKDAFEWLMDLLNPKDDDKDDDNDDDDDNFEKFKPPNSCGGYYDFRAEWGVLTGFNPQASFTWSAPYTQSVGAIQGYPLDFTFFANGSVAGTATNRTYPGRPHAAYLRWIQAFGTGNTYERIKTTITSLGSPYGLKLVEVRKLADYNKDCPQTLPADSPDPIPPPNEKVYPPVKPPTKTVPPVTPDPDKDIPLLPKIDDKVPPLPKRPPSKPPDEKVYPPITPYPDPEPDPDPNPKPPFKDKPPVIPPKVFPPSIKPPIYNPPKPDTPPKIDVPPKTDHPPKIDPPKAEKPVPDKPNRPKIDMPPTKPLPKINPKKPPVFFPFPEIPCDPVADPCGHKAAENTAQLKQDIAELKRLIAELKTKLDSLQFPSEFPQLTTIIQKLEEILNRLGVQVPNGLSGAIKKLFINNAPDRYLLLQLLGLSHATAFGVLDDYQNTAMAAINGIYANSGLFPEDLNSSVIDYASSVPSTPVEIAVTALGQDNISDINDVWKKGNRIIRASGNVLAVLLPIAMIVKKYFEDIFAVFSKLLNGLISLGVLPSSLLGIFPIEYKRTSQILEAIETNLTNANIPENALDIGEIVSKEIATGSLIIGEIKTKADTAQSLENTNKETQETLSQESITDSTTVNITLDDLWK